MTKVTIDLSMSLDGFITGPKPDSNNALGQGQGKHLHDWYFAGDKPSQYSDFMKPAEGSLEVVDEMFTAVGAMVVGRKWYDVVQGWGGNHPITGIPIFLVTHQSPTSIPKGKTPFTVVTDGVEDAIQQAKAAAGDKNVSIGGASIAQQGIKAGLVDEIFIHLVPLLLADGVRLFDHLDDTQFKLENIETIQTPLVTHLRYRIVK